MPNGATADDATVRLRVLVLGLSFFGVAIAVAVQPHLAAGHSPDLSRRCTITGTSGADLLTGTQGPDVICGGRDGLHDHLNGGSDHDRYRLDTIDRTVAVEAEM